MTSENQETTKPLSKKPIGYVLAVLGGTFGGPLGWLASPAVLYILGKTIKPKEDKQPNIFKTWALIGIVGAPVCLGINIAIVSTPSETTSSSDTSSKPQVTAKSAPLRPKPVNTNIGEYNFQNISVKKVEDPTARSGYVFQFYGRATNNGKVEKTRAEAMGYSIGACAFAKIKDQEDREFKATCTLPALLPGETSEVVNFAQSTAMPNSTAAKLCQGWGCTPLMKASN